MPFVWMYQHPSNSWSPCTWREYTQKHAKELEEAYQAFLGGGDEFTTLVVDGNVEVVVKLSRPMKQHSHVNDITRLVRRFWESGDREEDEEYEDQ